MMKLKSLIIALLSMIFLLSQHALAHEEMGNFYNAETLAQNREKTQSILNQDASFLYEPIARMKERLKEVKKITQNLSPEVRKTILEKCESELQILEEAYNAFNEKK